MNEQESVLDLVNELYSMIENAWNVPMGHNRCVVDRGNALALIQEIKDKLPKELADARLLVARKEEYIDRAQREGKAMREAAEEKSRKLVNEQEVVRMAQAQANQMLAEADAKSRELRRDAVRYLDEVLRTAEEAVSQTMEELQRTRARYRSAVGAGERQRRAAPTDTE